MGEHKNKITLSDGREVELLSPCDLEDHEDKEITLVFDNGAIYTGFVDSFDEDGDIRLTKRDHKGGIVLVMDKLVGWYYEQQND